MSISPIAVQISSRTLTNNATKIAAFRAASGVRPSPNPVMLIRKPPSLPPSCSGMKKSMLAMSVVKDMMSMQSI